MVKSNLKTGMIVTTRDKREYVVFRDALSTYEGSGDVIVNGQTKNWDRLDDYNDNLKIKSGAGYSDIVKVEQANHPYSFMDIDYDKSSRKLLWERKAPKKMTVSEIAEALGYEIEIIK